MELLIALGIMAVMIGALMYVMDPAKQMAKGRNAQRWADVTSVTNAIGQNMADNKGSFSCAKGTIPTSTTIMGSGASQYDIYGCLVPVYLPIIPHDPNASLANVTSSSSYNTQYSILRNATTGRVTVSAPFAEIGETIQSVR